MPIEQIFKSLNYLMLGGFSLGALYLMGSLDLDEGLRNQITTGVIAIASSLLTIGHTQKKENNVI